MSYDLGLADRLEQMFSGHPAMEKKKMFGGICWMLNGNMCLGIHKENLIIRVGLETAKKIIGQPSVGPMDITGKVMKGWALVTPDGFESDDNLTRYSNYAIDFVSTLPPK